MKQIGAEQLFRTDKESSISVPGSAPILWSHSYEIVCVQGGEIGNLENLLCHNQGKPSLDISNMQEGPITSGKDTDE